MINRIGFSNQPYYISFGLNPNNKRAIDRLHQEPDKVSAIQSFDMQDPDLQPCLDEFSHEVTENPTRYKEMNAILDKLDEIDINEENKPEVKGCLSTFVDFWSKLFMSTRTKAASVMDKVEMDHPSAGHLSRTATNPLYADIAIRNIENANEYIKENVQRGVCPDKDLLIELHKINTKDLKWEEGDDISYDNSDYSGIIRGSDDDKILLGGDSKVPEERLDDFMAWLNRNYNKDDTYQLAAQSYKKLLGICPFYDGNGRTIRSFIDALLYSKGYQMKTYPPNYTEARDIEMSKLRDLFEEHCEKVPEED